VPIQKGDVGVGRGRGDDGVGSGGGGGGGGTIAGTTSPVKPALPKSTRPPPVVSRTKIYHEVCSQTYLTSEDITKVLSGSILPPVENRVETNDAEVQVGYYCSYFLFLSSYMLINYILLCKNFAIDFTYSSMSRSI